jgi:hypothetical protein
LESTANEIDNLIRKKYEQAVNTGCMMSKYSPLQEYLSGLPAHQMDITLSFEQIEAIIHASLPLSSVHHQAWWANEKNRSHVEAHSWLDAGWKVDTVDQKQKWVRFMRF